MTLHDYLLLVGFLWALYAVIPAILTFPVVFWSRRRVRWYPWELLAFVLPFAVWLTLKWQRVDPSLEKGIDNLLESLFVGLGIPCATLMRVAVGQSCGRYGKVLAMVLLLLLCGLAAAVYFFTPDLGGRIGC
ncbi:MAG: hypothetical protein EOP88_02280 [Verrucomicrobiaceae bacterium]|nr:MAG: hypothetical protein EOP88_02280 [Verrucomicrobiaceae bacterium]